MTTANIAEFKIKTEKSADKPTTVYTDNGVFTPKGDGVYFSAYGKSGETLPEKRICSPLTIMAQTRTPTGTGWGKLLDWRDRDNRIQRWAMPNKLLSGESAEVAGELLDRGLDIQPGKQKRVIEYIHACNPFNLITCTNKTGWHSGAYVTPDKVYGDGSAQYIYQAESGGVHSIFSNLGELEAWKKEVSAYAVGNSRLMFALSIAFAGSLATPANIESGGVHLVGGSSSGKSTAQRVAASVWGNPDTFKRSWRATATGLESIASLHNDNILILDEISEMNPKEASETAYMLGNGSGKTRSHKGISLRPMFTWTTLFLSSGEVTLQELMNEEHGRKRVKAGQEVRIANIQADAGLNRGIFEELHSFDKPSLLADHLRYQTSKNYGVAGSYWLEAITKHHRQLWDELPENVASFCSQVVPNDASGQVHRVAKRFGLIAVAGELATSYGLTGWKEGQASAAATRCFMDWLAEFGTGNREENQILDTVLGFLERNTARFQDLTLQHPYPVPDRVGFTRPSRDRDCLEYIIPARQMPRVMEGLNLNMVIAVLQKKGLINEPDKEGKNTRNVKLPGQGSTRCFIISPDQELLQSYLSEADKH
ncbi:MAG TPA: DUF927 domain-containing protein [Thiolinea sp.]|nr:DUF927 domain-containing protein [Thiolinea sp.]